MNLTAHRYTGKKRSSVVDDVLQKYLLEQSKCTSLEMNYHVAIKMNVKYHTLLGIDLREIVFIEKKQGDHKLVENATIYLTKNKKKLM